MANRRKWNQGGLKTFELPPKPRSLGQASPFAPGTPPVADFNAPISDADSGLGPGCYRAPCPPNMIQQEPLGEALIDRPIGDAGAGLPKFRTTHFFWQVHEPAAAPNTILRPFVLASDRSYDRRLRLWYVSFCGRDVLRDAGMPPATLGPLGFNDLLPRLADGPLQSTAVKARVEVQDECGRRFVDIDVLGSRSWQFYAWAVTVYALLPTDAYEVTPTGGGLTPNDQNNPQFGGVVADSVFGALVSPTVVNATQIPDKVTRFVSVPAAGPDVLVPTPPGACSVQIHSLTSPVPVGVINFDTGVPPGSAVVSNLGIITFPAGQTSTAELMIPNALAIRFSAFGAGGDFTLVYTIEA